MIILHIVRSTGNLCNGVHVVVPQHIQAQSEFAEVACVNLANVKLGVTVPQFDFYKGFSVGSLPAPFNKPDIVIFHECYRVEYLKISKGLRKLKIPYVIIPHGELTREAQKKKHLKKVAANILLFNKFIKKAAAVQCLSVREMQNTRFGKKKIVGTNGINLPDIKKQTFSQCGVKLLYVGRLDAFHKGLDILLEAVGKVKKLFVENDVKLYIYGPDYQGRYAHIEDLIKQNDVLEVVSLSHEITGEEKIAKLLEADVFVQTSRFEGMPLGILEALSYGIPCLVTEGTTLKSVIEQGDAGWGAETDSDSVSKALEKVIAEKERLSEKSANAVKVVVENFSWDIIAQNTVNDYKKIAGIN